MLVFYLVLVLPRSMYMLVFCGGLSSLVQIERPCSIYVGILFCLSMLVRLVQACFMYMLLCFLVLIR